ncbi:hypothetical protein [Helicobacter himalayensis]|uniref:hypothetical protein n=1 Tax=Helicobacter himalayensis TaxID=1591088 RepID=UPI000AA8C86E|nr:hypothetical protein [Helicobacter himalayensis]
MFKQKYRKIHRLLGVKRIGEKIDLTNKSLQAIQTLQILNSLDLPEELKQEFALQFYPNVSGEGIATLNDAQSCQNVKHYLSLVRPVVSPSLKLERVGDNNDGGYVMFAPPPPIEANTIKPQALSLGVSPYSPWDLAMANRGYKVMQYDASIEKASHNHPNITFIKKFVGAQESHDTISFDFVVKSNNLNKDAHNIAQIDIEDAEWDILENIDLGAISPYFAQVLFEFHYCDPRNEALTSRRLKALEKILEFYTPIHTHFNHCGQAFCVPKALSAESKLYFWCSVVEVSYLRNDLIPKDAVPKSGSGLIAGLDYPNLPNFPDLPIIF